MYKRTFFAAVIILLFISLASPALAQTYSFSLDEQIVDVYWNEDGTMSLDYVLVFTNDPFASPIDYVDLGLPTTDFIDSSISADVNGRPLSDISSSGYMGDGVGVAIGLGQSAIQPGDQGVVRVHVGDVRNVLREDSQDKEYASAVFSPTWFASKFVQGNTALTVTYHLPPGVQPEEPRWHSAPDGFPTEPTTALDEQGRVTYSWSNASANGYTQYLFGASFPKKYVPESAIGSTSFLEMLGISFSDLVSWTCCCGIGLLIIVVIALSIRSSRRRKLQYLPPKVSIEGHGVKRGLTAVEAAILMEQPMDKILTMILFSVIKKDAATVLTREPLEIEIVDSLPTDLHSHEVQFLEAFKLKKKSARRAALQDMMTDLVKNVAKKMKGFSRKETVAYYRKIMERAWQQVEAADTPEVKSEKFDDVMEWTMLDREYDDRTRRTFGSGPVFVPIWWHRYDPTFRPSAPSKTSSMPTSRGTGPSVSLPNLPGGEFAASMVTGVQTMSSNVIGSLTDFTSNITNKTNPVPVSKSSGGWSSGGGGGCACACACAGCACACAGGGR